VNPINAGQVSHASDGPGQPTQRSARALSLRRLGRSAVYALLVAGGAIYLFPLLWMLSTSLKQLSQISAWPPQLIPRPFTLVHYIEGWKKLPFALFYRNTLLITSLNIVGTLLSSTLVAYGFARLRFPGRNVLFLVLLSTMMLPGQVTMIPLYVLFSRMNWLGTYKPLIVPSFFGSAFNVFLLRQFLMTIPHELDDAARIDGCGYIRTLISIILPIVMPALGVVAIFTFTYNWNDFMGPLIYLNKITQLTVTAGLRSFQTTNTGQHVGQLMAMATLALLPQVVVFFFTQKQMVQGVTLTGIKG
jgi:multiple sugar transport system permease protein